jgi:molybdopterin synthase catalytic subunit
MEDSAVRVWVGAGDFDPGAEIVALGRGGPDIGAVASFVGLVRGEGEAVSAMTLEHYPGMTEKQIALLVEEAARRWQIDRVAVLHRVGRLQPGDRIVFVGVASRHRGDAFAACEFLIDWLKTRAPFWKLEEGAAGEHWVAARKSDAERAQKWQESNKDG